MSTKAKIFPIGAAALLLGCLAAGCGATATQTPETPCERACADSFVTCLENCVDDDPCRDECMIERSVCEQPCREPPAPAGEAGTAGH
jgi:hypothetical protein